MSMSERYEVANLLESLKSSEVSLDDWESQYFEISRALKKRRDPDSILVKDIFLQVWGLYDDFSDDYLEIDECVEELLNRYAFFLRFGGNYEWPSLHSGWCLFTVIKRWRLQKHGDLEAWPFRSKKDYADALKRYSEKSARELPEGPFEK